MTDIASTGYGPTMPKHAEPTPEPAAEMPDSGEGPMADPQTHLDTDPVNDPDES